MVPRLVQLYVGLGLYGLSTAMFIRSDLGVDPWDVFHLGVAIQTGMSIGTVIILTGQRCCCCGSRCVSCRGWALSVM